MTKKIRTTVAALICAAFAMLLIAAGITSCSSTGAVDEVGDNLYRKNLSNGLGVYVAENHNVPLVYVEIAVRAGAVTQEPQTAGLFHLYEHMMFKGNALYKDAASVTRALSDLGVTNWNGSTGIDYVNYYFTIPSAKLEEGLAFWNAAIRSPLMDAGELENEKRVVLSEIEGDRANPLRVFYDYLRERLFPDAPYRVDPAGSFSVVQNATVADLRAIQSRYYIPANAALFIGGDVDADEAFRLSDAIFGTWSNNGNDAPADNTEQTKEPFDETQYCVMPTDQITEEYAQIMIQFRGPDADFDIEDTYAADYLVYLLNEPNGEFVQGLYNNEEFAIPDYNNSWASYGTVRANGAFEFGTTVTDTGRDLAARAEKILNAIQTDILPRVANDEALFTDEYKERVVGRLEDSEELNNETAEGLLSTIRSWWTSTNDDYYYTYYDRLRSVTQDDVKAVIEKYFTGHHPLVSVLLNPAVYDGTKREYSAMSYYEVSPEESAWWEKSEYQAATGAGESDAAEYVADENIYVPSGEAVQSTARLERNIQTATLSNGIPIYINKTDSPTACVGIFARGGVENLTVDTSGLETTLFSFMAMSSENYSYDERTQFEYDTSSSIGYRAWLSGSALYLSSLEKYFNEALDVFLDGFLHPTFPDREYNNTMNNLRQGIQSMLNDPQSFLSYTINDTLYKGHPYDVKNSVTPLSLNSITVENLQNYHRSLLLRGGLFVVASGAVDKDALVSRLNETLGTLESGDATDVAKSSIPPLTVTAEDPVILRLAAGSGTAYIARVFASPANADDDYIPASLAASIYSDILFNVVRERHGVCYTPTSYIVGSKAPYGVEYLYNVSDFENFIPAMDEARTYMENGQVVERTSEDGSYEFSTIEDRLESYKNSYINGTYASQATAGGQVTLMGYNMLQFDDLDFDLKQLDILDETTSADIERVFKKYWVNAPSRWFAATGPSEQLAF